MSFVSVWFLLVCVFVVVVKVLAEFGGSNAKVAEIGLKAIGSLALYDTNNNRLLGEAGAAAGTHTLHTQ